jgi:NAD(P)-dependent dehydrogenase (short-subunit alcohol dehydrogenase family)/muconolactone delta-isomerase
MRTREAARARELAAQGHLLRLWRPPLQPGEWRSLGLFAADNDGQLEELLASMPLRVWRTDEVAPLSPHPNDPAAHTEPRGSTTPAAGASTRGSPAADDGKVMSDSDRKVAIVTGGSHGIGAGLVAEYRRRGWAVVATSRTIRPTGDPFVLTVDGDVSDPATTERIISGAVETFGRIDTLVNDAGVFISKPFTDYTVEDYALAVGVNLAGFFWLTQRAITEMLERGSGHVVNITSTLADYANSSTPSVLTSLTKGGLASATKALAIEYAARGIRVNAVSPGIIQTPEHAPETYNALAALHPLGRVGQVSDIVDGILFLESSPFITGEILHIDGGQIAGH